MGDQATYPFDTTDFSEDALRAIELARQYAVRRKAAYLTPVHVCIGSVYVRGSISEQVLQEAEVFPAQAASWAAVWRPRFQHNWEDVYFGFVRDARKEFGDAAILPEHLLLAAIRQTEDYSIASTLYDFDIGKRAAAELVKRARDSRRVDGVHVSWRLDAALRKSGELARTHDLRSPDANCLLIGLLSQPNGLAAKVVKNKGVKPHAMYDKAREGLPQPKGAIWIILDRFTRKSGADGSSADSHIHEAFASTSETKEIMDYAVAAAAAEGRRVVWTADVLEALARRADSVASALTGAGLTVDNIRESLKSMRSGAK